MSGIHGQGSGADSYVEAPTQLLAVETEQLVLLETQRAAFEPAVIGESCVSMNGKRK